MSKPDYAEVERKVLDRAATIQELQVTAQYTCWVEGCAGKWNHTAKCTEAHRALAEAKGRAA